MIAALDPEHIEMVLKTCLVGRIGCWDGVRPYVVPVTYTYDDGCVVGHTNEGQKVRIMRRHSFVCFQVDDVQDLVRWRSVIAWGTYEELGGDEARLALVHHLARITRRSSEELSYRREAEKRDVVPTDEGARRIRLGESPGIVYRIRLTEKTGRFETA